MINFKNKKILITGASGGIGNALVKKFSALEGNVLGTGTKMEKLEQLKQLDLPEQRSKEWYELREKLFGSFLIIIIKN